MVYVSRRFCYFLLINPLATRFVPYLFPLIFWTKENTIN
jgi:hypothetical protein